MGLSDAINEHGGSYKFQSTFNDRPEDLAQGALFAFQDDVFGAPKAGQNQHDKTIGTTTGDAQKSDNKSSGTASGDSNAGTATGTASGDPSLKTPPANEADQRRRSFADSLNAVRRDVESKLPPREDRRHLDVITTVTTDKPLRTDEQIRTENRKITERVAELERRLVQDRYDPVKRNAIVKELEGILKRIDILKYNLPDGASDADIQAAQDAEVKRYAKEYGISPDLPIDQLYMRVNREWHNRQLRRDFENDCKRYKLDPEKTTYGDLRFRWDCEKYKLDPRTATRDQAKAARARDHLQYWAQYHGLDPTRASQADVNSARNRHVFEMDCLYERIDPRTTTPEKMQARRDERERESHDSWCKTYNLDPKKTTKQQLEEVHNFHTDCHMYKLDPKTATRDQLAKAKIEIDSKRYGLDPKTATAQDVDRAREQAEHSRLCTRYRLDARATTAADLHEVRCETFGVPLATTRDALLDLEDRWDSRGY